MGKYGWTAEIATKMLTQKKVNDPIKAWEIAVLEVFPDSPSSRNKSCPKNTFLGLCEDGYLIGVEKGNYTRSKKNKDYAIKAVSILSTNDSLNEKELWSQVINEDIIKHNSQMDVVKTLWDNKLIKQK